MWITFVLLSLIFYACGSESESNVVENSLIGHYWVQHERQMEILIDKVDNAETYWELWDENGFPSYYAGGELYYFVDNNTVYYIPYIGAKFLSIAKNEGFDDLLFTITYGYDTIHFCGDLDNPYIYSYEILDGKLYIYSNSDIDQFNLVDDGFVENGGRSVFSNIELEEEIIKENPNTKITEGKKVDLGLNVKWAGWNIGADSPEEYGGYYSWGEVSEKNNYTVDSYMCDWGNTVPIYIGGTEYDVARTNWGKEWRLPSYDDFEELVKNCKMTVIRYKDTRGIKITGPNGNSIFLPYSGYKHERELNECGEFAEYWMDDSRTFLQGYRLASVYRITLSGGIYGYGFAHQGNPVRAVSDN